jgi:hypothetical protein
MKLPVVSGSDAAKAFRKAGYELDGKRPMNPSSQRPVKTA